MNNGNKTKLELTWIGKDARPRLEPRILLEDPAVSYHAWLCCMNDYRRRFTPWFAQPIPYVASSTR